MSTLGWQGGRLSEVWWFFLAHCWSYWGVDNDHVFSGDDPVEVAGWGATTRDGRLWATFSLSSSSRISISSQLSSLSSLSSSTLLLSASPSPSSLWKDKKTNGNDLQWQPSWCSSVAGRSCEKSSNVRFQNLTNDDSTNKKKWCLTIFEVLTKMC